MAADSRLLDDVEVGLPLARVYSWDGPWVSLGRFQRPERALVTSVVPHVVRPTGGKAVLHGHDMTLGLAVTYGDLGLDPNGSKAVSAVYRRLVPLVIGALRDSGVNACLGEETVFVGSRGQTADCFAHVAPNDIVNPLTGQKVCGCALKLGQHAALVQASVPIGPPLVDVGTVFANPQTVSWSQLDRDEFAMSLDRLLGRTVTKSLKIP